MSRIVNLRMKGKQLVTSFGILQFDSDGVVDLPDEQAASFLQMRGFELAEESKNSGLESSENLSLGNNPADEENKQDDAENALDDDETFDFDKLTVPQLKKYAKDHGIDLMGANRKDEIIPLILGSEA